jgi:ferredoxin-NADP reductase
MRVFFVRSEEIAKNIKSFWFRPEREVRYIAGQFIELHIPHTDNDSRGVKRWFTLSSSPTDDLLSITTKHATENGSSFKQALFSLEEGTELNMASPIGDFILPKDPTIPLIFVAGGIGCTPFHSIIKFLQDTNEQRDITLIYAANSEEEVAFADTFEKLGDRFIKVIGERLTADKIVELSKATDRHYIYLSGPEPMVEILNNDMKKLGFNKKHIHTDFFPNYTSI